MRCVAPVVGKELAVDRPAASVPVFNVMPETDAAFAKMPAEVDFLAVVQSREVQQTHLDVFQLTACRMNLID